MPTSYHMVHYRRFNADKAKSTLEKLCRSALGNTDGARMPLWQRAQDRLYDLGDGRLTMLNRVADLKSAVLGEMCLVQSRGLQAVLEHEASKVQLSQITTAEIFKLDERAAPKGSQFIRGMAYWLAIGDHLFFVKMQTMTADLIQGYIDWLIRIKTSTVSPDHTFQLQAEFDRSQVSGDIGDIQRLQIGGVSAPRIAVAPVGNDSGEIPGKMLKKLRKIPTARKIADKFVMFDQAVQVMEIVFGQARTDALVDSLGPEEYVSVDTSFKVRGKRTAESKDQLKAIANDLANLTDAKVQVEGKDGKLSDDDAILRTRMPFDLPHAESNFLDFDNVADQLQEVYSRFVKDGKIPA